MLTKRAQILFDQDLWDKLTRLAVSKKTSVGSLVREAVIDKCDQEEIAKKRQLAIEKTLKGRLVSKQKIDYKKLINYGRKF